MYRSSKTSTFDRYINKFVAAGLALAAVGLSLMIISAVFFLFSGNPAGVVIGLLTALGGMCVSLASMCVDTCVELLRD